MDTEKLVKALKVSGIVLLIIIVVYAAISLIAWGVSSLGYSLWRGTMVEADALEDGFATNNNGGLTYDQVKQQQADASAPYADDVFADFAVVEYNNYVVIYRAVDDASRTKYYNVLFTKTDNGLVWDGAIGVDATINVNWLTGERYWDTVKYTLQDTSPNVSYNQTIGVWEWYSLFNFHSIWGNRDNIVLFSDFRPDYVAGWSNYTTIANLWINQTSDLNKLYNITRQYLLDNIVAPYFLTWGDDVELINGAYDSQDATAADKTYLRRFHEAYTYLWQSAKTADQTSRVTYIDMAEYYAKFVSDSEATKYPIAPENLSEYAGLQYYRVYNCDVTAHVSYTWTTSEISRAPDTDSLNGYQITPGVQQPEQARLNIVLRCADDSDLSGYDVGKEPVTIGIVDKLLVIDTKQELSQGKSVALELGKSYSYTIQSAGLLFSAPSGSLEITAQDMTLYLDYTYTSTYLDFAVSLNVLTSYGTIDLTSYPVVISLTGSNHQGTYTYTFDAEPTEVISQTLIKGDYVYTISSDYLIFNNTSGTLSVDNDHRSATFACTVPIVTDAAIRVDKAVPTTAYETMTSAPIVVAMTNETYTDIADWYNSSWSTTINIYQGEDSLVHTQQYDTGYIINNSTWSVIACDYEGTAGETYYIQVIFSAAGKTLVATAYQYTCDSAGNAFVLIFEEDI